MVNSSSTIKNSIIPNLDLSYVVRYLPFHCTNCTSSICDYLQFAIKGWIFNSVAYFVAFLFAAWPGSDACFFRTLFNLHDHHDGKIFHTHDDPKPTGMARNVKYIYEWFNSFYIFKAISKTQQDTCSGSTACLLTYVSQLNNHGYLKIGEVM